MADGQQRNVRPPLDDIEEDIIMSDGGGGEPNEESNSNNNTTAMMQSSSASSTTTTRPQHHNQHETSLLPRKRNQATKSPAEKMLSASSMAIMDGDSSSILKADDKSAAANNDNEMKQTTNNISKLLNNYQDDDYDDGQHQFNEGVGGEGLSHSFSHPTLLLQDGNNNNLSLMEETRTSLNASFDAAASVHPSAAGINDERTEVVAGGGSSIIMKNPKYSSPKRRKQSLDSMDDQLNQQQQQQQQSIATGGTLPQHLNMNMQHYTNQPSSSATTSGGGKFTPLRPPKTTKRRTNRKNKPGPIIVDHGGSILFSPKPMYSEQKKMNTKKKSSRGSSTRPPPRPKSGNDDESSANNNMNHHHPPSSPLTPSPKDTIQQQQQNNLGGAAGYAGATSNSPGTPFRFHAFPASLPRVNPRSEGEGVDDISGGLDNIINNDEQRRKNPLPPTVGSAQRLNLRPKPTPRQKQQRQEQAEQSPASRRRLFDSDKKQSASSSTHDAAAAAHQRVRETTTNDSSSKDDNSNPLLFEGSNSKGEDVDISGDWSECTTSNKSVTNECIRYSKVPSHVFQQQNRQWSTNASAAGQQLQGNNNNVLENLEEEKEDDTVIMDEDDFDDHNIEEDDGEEEADYSSSRRKGGTRLNFSSPEPTNSGEIAEEEEDESNPHHHELSSALHPQTPRGMVASVGGQEQFQMDNLEVSPIIRMPDDIIDEEDHEMAEEDRDEDEKNNIEMHPPLFSHAASPILPNKSSDLLLHRSSINEGTTMMGVGMNTSANSSSTIFSTASTANVNNTTLNNSNLSSNNNNNVTTHRPTARKLHRPKPDTSAFDTSGTPSQHSIGSKDSGFHSHNTGATVNSNNARSVDNTSTNHRLLCPPTPIRTPAWAHHASMDHVGVSGRAHGNNQPGALKRANSLISNKVLAACPPRVLDNLSSLEDSMLENDISGSTMDTTADGGLDKGLLAATSSNFTPVEEETQDEMASSMFRSLTEDGCSEQIISPTLLNNNNDDDKPSATMLSTKPLTNNDNSVRKTSTTHQSSSIEESNFSDFENLGILGSGAFADVYKVRSKKDGRLYAIKRTRRQFRGVKDRERAMAEVHTMRRLQSALLNEAASSRERGHHASNDGSSGGHHHQHHSKSSYGLYLLFFIRAWQQDGFFYCQTELCSRATCRHLRMSISSEWERDVIRYPSLQLCLLESRTRTSASLQETRKEEDDHITQQQDRIIPESAIWQMCHDISRGLFHIHSYGMVHYDIKPSNIFFVYNTKWGTICKIGDFGLAGDIGTKDDGQEGDTAYMANELLLSSCAKHPTADIFSLGLALYELAASPFWTLPREGDRWHEIRSGSHRPDLPPSRSENLVKLIQSMIRSNVNERPTAEDISELDEVKRASALSDSFLSQYISDVEKYDSRREMEMETAEEEARRRSSTPVVHNNLGSDVARRVRDMRTPTNDDHPL